MTDNQRMTNEQYIAQRVVDYATDAGAKATLGGFTAALNKAAKECSVMIGFCTPDAQIKIQEVAWLSAVDHVATLISCFDVTVAERRDINPTTEEG